MDFYVKIVSMFLGYKTFGGTRDFFKKHGVAVMTARELFEFIVDPCISDEWVDSYLDMV